MFVEGYGSREFDIEPASILEKTFRHGGWARRRRLIFDAMRRVGFRHHRLDNFAECGAGAWVMKRLDGQDLKIQSNCCHDRFCVPCGITRATTLTQNLKSQVKDMQPLFITLTLRHSSTPLKEQMDRLYRSFLVLRRRPFWLAAIKGGAAFFEVKISERDGLWHPHLHILADGRFIPKLELSIQWHSVTGDSSIVDIKRPRAAGEVAAYVTKYVTKPADSSVYEHPDKLDELLTTLRGRRLVATFGDWTKLKLTEILPDGHTWVPVMHLDELLHAAAAQEPAALDLLEALQRKYPSFANVLPLPPPPPVDTDF